MNGDEIQYVNILPPLAGAVACITVGVASSRTDLSALALVPGKPTSTALQGRFITMMADADIYFFFNTSNSLTVDETSAAGISSSSCVLLPAKTPMRFRFGERGYVWLVHKAPVQTILRIWCSSANLDGN